MNERRPTNRPRRAAATVVTALAVATAAAGTASVVRATAAAATEPVACDGQPASARDGLTETTTTTADLDGDGRRQAVTLGRSASGEPRWILAIDSRGGGVLTATVPDPTPGQPLWLTGRGDVDGDHDEEVVIRGPAGASTEFVQVWGLVGCRWAPVTQGGTSEPTQFLVGASVMHGNGVRCTYGERAEALTYQSLRIESSDRHRVTVQRWVWSHLHLDQVGGDETVEVGDDELNARFPADFACGRPNDARDVPPTAKPTTPTTASGVKAATAVRAQPRFTG
jgi:hypothetical protein